MNSKTDNQFDKDSINLADIWFSARNNLKTFFSITTLSTVIAIIYAISIENVYRASVLAVPNTTEGKISSPLSGIGDQFAGLAGMAGIDISGGQQEIETNLAVIESKQFTKIFLEKNNIYEELYPDLWDRNAGTWSEDAKIPLFDDVLKDVYGIQNILFDKRVGQLSVTVDLNDPEYAAKWANQFMETANDYLKESAILEAKKNIRFLNNELSNAKVVQMRQLLNEMIARETQTIMIANTRDDFAFRIIDPALVPDKKIRPQRSLIVILGAIIGLIIASVLSYIRR